VNTDLNTSSFSLFIRENPVKDSKIIYVKQRTLLDEIGAGLGLSFIFIGLIWGTVTAVKYVNYYSLSIGLVLWVISSFLCYKQYAASYKLILTNSTYLLIMCFLLMVAGIANDEYGTLISPVDDWKLEYMKYSIYAIFNIVPMALPVFSSLLIFFESRASQSQKTIEENEEMKANISLFILLMLLIPALSACTDSAQGDLPLPNETGIEFAKRYIKTVEGSTPTESFKSFWGERVTNNVLNDPIKLTREINNSAEMHKLLLADNTLSTKPEINDWGDDSQTITFMFTLNRGPAGKSVEISHSEHN